MKLDGPRFARSQTIRSSSLNELELMEERPTFLREFEIKRIIERGSLIEKPVNTNIVLIGATAMRHSFRTFP